MPLTNSTSAATVKAARNPSIAAVLALLAETWPHCFAVYENRRRPLKIGIHREILAALGDAISAEELAKALRCYVSNKVYRSRLVMGAIRIGLDGLPAGTVTERDALAAKPKPTPTSVAASHSGDVRHQSPLTSTENFEAAPAHAAHAVTAKRLSLADLRAAAQARKLTAAEAVS